MDRYCPECNSTMTPSLVGYLCPDCGHVQRFYTMTGTELQSTSTPKSANTSVKTNPKDPDENISASEKDLSPESTEKVKMGIKGTLKRLTTPELPPPHDYILESIKSPNAQQKAELEASNARPVPIVETSEQSSGNLDSAQASKDKAVPRKKRGFSKWLFYGAIVLLVTIAILYFLNQK